MSQPTHDAVNRWLTGLVLAACLMVFATSASAFTVIKDGDNAIGVLNLEVRGVLYNVEFVLNTAENVYGTEAGLPFDAFELVDAINSLNFALDSEDVVSVGPGERLTYGVGLAIDETGIGGGGLAAYGFSSFTTDVGWTGINLDIKMIDEIESIADFTVVPIPAAVWLFGSALGLLGWVKRRTA